MSEITEEAVRNALRSVNDPEVGMNIVDLGLIYGVTLAPGKIQINMTMTTPACPMGSMITDQAQAALKAIAPEADITVQLVWEPSWDSSMMSAEAKKHFGW